MFSYICYKISQKSELYMVSRRCQGTCMTQTVISVRCSLAVYLVTWYHRGRGSCVPARSSNGGVYVDKDEQQEVEDDADDSEHCQEPLLRCAQVRTREVHVKGVRWYDYTQKQIISSWFVIYISVSMFSELAVVGPYCLNMISRAHQSTNWSMWSLCLCNSTWIRHWTDVKMTGTSCFYRLR